MSNMYDFNSAKYIKIGANLWVDSLFTSSVLISKFDSQKYLAGICARVYLIHCIKGGHESDNT